MIRVANRAMVDAHIAAAFARLTRGAGGGSELRAANTAYGFVNDVAALSRASRVAPRRWWTRRTGRCRSPRRRCGSATVPRALGPVPAIGEHSAAIRAEFAA